METGSFSDIEVQDLPLHPPAGGIESSARVRGSFSSLLLRFTVGVGGWASSPHLEVS